MTATTVPLAAAVVLFGADDRLATCAVQLGARREISLERVKDVLGEEDARRLAVYWDTARELWDGGSGPAVVIRRRLVSARQRDGRDGRVDLHDELTAIEEVEVLERVSEALLGPTPPDGEVSGIRAETTENGMSVTVTHRSIEWPAALGGPASPGELHRHVTMVANHAKWRDRKVRRLVRVEVATDEVWPDPAGF